MNLFYGHDYLFIFNMDLDEIIRSSDMTDEIAFIDINWVFLVW